MILFCQVPVPKPVGLVRGGDSPPGGVGLAGPQGWYEEWQSWGFGSPACLTPAVPGGSGSQAQGTSRVLTGQGLDPGPHRNGAG